LARGRHAGDYHGKDGLGDVPDPDAPDLDLLQQRKAVKAMIKIAKENAGEVRQRSLVTHAHRMTHHKRSKHDSKLHISPKVRNLRALRSCDTQ